jgi:hypothetical protein
MVRDRTPLGLGATLSRAVESAYRFTASVKLAVISLLALGAVLGYATFYERSYGRIAVQDQIYQSGWFALLLAFLGANILCAALIRYPWTRRQTGFVVTHAGLLVILLGSWLSLSVTYDGQVGLVEGQRATELIRQEHPAVWVQAVDAKTDEPTDTTAYKLPFQPGAFNWYEPGRLVRAPLPAAARVLSQGLIVVCATCLLALAWLYYSHRMPGISRAALGALAGMLVAGIAVPSVLLASRGGPRVDVLTRGDEPFRLEVLNYYPVSTPPLFRPVPGEGGVPMIRPSLLVTPPNADVAVDLLESGDDGTGNGLWLQAAEPRARRAARNLSSVLLTFQYAERPGMVEDFLDLPDNPATESRIRVHYTDRAGQRRVFIWPADKGEGSTLELPDSDVRMTFFSKKTAPIDILGNADGVFGATGETALEFIEMHVQKGDKGEPIQYLACSSLPNLPNQPADPEGDLRISYYTPPRLSDTPLRGRSSVVDLLAAPDGALYYRAVNREGLRGKGPIQQGQTVDLVKKGPTQPVSLSLVVKGYMPSGIAAHVVEPATLPPSQIENGVPAALVRLSRGKESREVWLSQRLPEHDQAKLQRSPFDFHDADHDGRDDAEGHHPRFQTIHFTDGPAYRVSLDFDRRPLGFEVGLVDFEMETDPGTQMAASYTSDVKLTDPSRNVTDEPHRITMNVPMTWRDRTFYQSSYNRVFDSRGRETGQFLSVFSVRYDPVWCWGTMYAGCLLVVLGTFLQFYMRAGLFTDGGKSERLRAERKAAKRKGRPANKDAEPADLQPQAVAASGDDFDL